MNLIEQLGGYEKAKEIAFDPLHPQMTHVSNDGRHWVNEEFSHIPEIQEQIPTMIRIKDIRKALLEHRRQHNIFEVGDKVVLAQSYPLDTVHKIKRIENLTPHIKGSETTYFLENSLGCWLFQIKHATDEEIKAGKRLEGGK